MVDPSYGKLRLQGFARIEALTKDSIPVTRLLLSEDSGE